MCSGIASFLWGDINPQEIVDLNSRTLMDGCLEPIAGEGGEIEGVYYTIA